MLKYYRSYILYRRSINTMVIGMLLTIAILAFLFSSVYSGALLEQIGIQQQHTAAVLMNNVGNLRAELLQLAAYMCNDNAYVNSMMFKTNPDRLRDFFGGLFIKQLLASNSNVSFIAVYNQSIGELYSTSALTASCAEEIKARAAMRYGMGEMSGFEPITLRLRVVKGMRSEIPSIALFFYSPLSNPNSVGALVIGISCDALTVSVEGAEPDDRQTTLIVDEAGRVLSHPDPALLLSDVSGEAFMSAVPAPGVRASGSFRDTVDGQSTLITYETVSFGWTYLSLISYDAILSKLIILRNITILASLGMIAFAGLYAVLGARHTFRPIEYLIDPASIPGGAKPYKSGRDADIEFLLNRIRAYQQQRGMETSIQNYALKQWVSGEATADQARTAMYAAGIREGEPMVLVWASVDRTEAFAALTLDAQAELMDALFNHVCAGFERTAARCLNIPWTAHEHAILLLSADAPESVAPPLNSALRTFEQEFTLSCCASMVPCAANTGALPAALREARELYQQHFALADPSNKVIESRGAPFAFVSYDSAREHAVLDAVRKGGEPEIRDAIREMTQKLRVCAPEDARNYAHRLMKNVLDAGHWPPEITARRLEAIPAVLSMDTLALLEEGMIRFFLGLRSEARKPEAPGQDNSIVEAGIRMTEERFKDKDFDLSSAAQALSLAPTYFNRVFRKYAGMSFSAYLTTYRLHQACILLRTTREPLSQVFLSIGFTNENYCYTLFKKEFGLTPSQYRERYGDG